MFRALNDYIYDAFGRLREIRVRGVGTGALVAEYQYNALGHRISWHYDTTQSGGGAPDGTVDSNDPTFHFVHDERWRLVATYRNTDSDPKEQFLSHQAGLGGSGSSSYIDGVILRDDHDADWTAAADSTLERRIYYVQNWRADVVALLSDNGRILERVRYEPYGTPFGQPPMDFTGSSDNLNDDYGVPDGDIDGDDFTFFNDATTAGSARADLTESSDDTNATYGRPDGDRDSDDFFYYLAIAADNESRGRDVLSSSDLRNRKGYAGYEWDPGVQAGTPIYHVRHRVYMTETGRWNRRDPMGYIDGMSVYEYARSTPILFLDSMGLCATTPCSTGSPDDAVRTNPRTLGYHRPSPIEKLRGLGIDINGACGGCVPLGVAGLQLCFGVSVSAERKFCSCESVNNKGTCSYSSESTVFQIYGSVTASPKAFPDLSLIKSGPCELKDASVSGGVARPGCPDFRFSRVEFMGSICLSGQAGSFGCELCLDLQHLVKEREFRTNLNCGLRLSLDFSLEIRVSWGFQIIEVNVDPPDCYCYYEV